MAEFRNTPPTMVETFMDCGGQLMQDTTLQVLAGITAPSIPFPKSFAKEQGWIVRSIRRFSVTSALQAYFQATSFSW